MIKPMNPWDIQIFIDGKLWSSVQEFSLVIEEGAASGTISDLFTEAGNVKVDVFDPEEHEMLICHRREDEAVGILYKLRVIFIDESFGITVDDIVAERNLTYVAEVL